MEDKFRKWLENIVEQDYESARRVPLNGKMAIYKQNYRKKVKMEQMVKKHEKAYALVKKIVRFG